MIFAVQKSHHLGSLPTETQKSHHFLSKGSEPHTHLIHDDICVLDEFIRNFCYAYLQPRDYLNDGSL